MGFLKKIIIVLPYDTAIPLPGIYLDETIIFKKIHSPSSSYQHYLNSQDLEVT